jgi:hypothetical protein
MDDKTIDVSWMDEIEYRQYMRHLSDISTCPCVSCNAVCDRPQKIAECDAYQLWYERCMERRQNAKVR